jgi:hypothetical protein
MMLPQLIILLPVGADTMNILPNSGYWLFYLISEASFSFAHLFFPLFNSSQTNSLLCKRNGDIHVYKRINLSIKKEQLVIRWAAARLLDMRTNDTVSLLKGAAVHLRAAEILISQVLNPYIMHGRMPQSHEVL